MKLNIATLKVIKTTPFNFNNTLFLISIYSDKSDNLFATFHAYNIGTSSGSSSTIRDVLTQPLWGKYFDLFKRFGISLDKERLPNNRESPWTQATNDVANAALPLIALYKQLINYTIPINQVITILSLKDTFCHYISLLVADTSEAEVNSTLSDCDRTINDYQVRIEWTRTFLEVWIPLLDASVDIGQLRHFMESNTSGITVKEAKEEVNEPHPIFFC